ncbi:uncharacterized protein LOC110422019 isoform X2 [Herrania umbratica]|uniref:Uncharacterized protein LOC110422019 isoform X2 n=1 Tax=Herrania umbratica TaxID=108875 RepID=A0A6J1AWY3_9ROSI|nr:uncharacterized protein LOC110422019 isoform X2 [Herrania umbratica]
MRRSTRKSSMGLGLGVEEPLNSNSIGSFSTRFSLSSFVKRVEKLTDDQRNAVKKVGFGNLLLIPNQMLSKNLLVELMERWHSEEHGFMLLPGMVKITLMDVALILGIRVIGDPILLREDEAFSDLESDYGAALWKRKITVASLESRLDSLGETVNEDFVRTFILFMFGTFLFPNANGKVDSRYLSFLKNLDDIGHFAWGAAVLEDIFMWLNKRKESNVQYVGGCLILLQIWSYEHMDLARPDLIDSYMTFPRACRWENSRSHQRQWFTAKFRELQDHQITWQLQPTSEELEFDIVNELLEVESSSIDNSSDSGSVISGKKVNLMKQLELSRFFPELQTMGFPSESCPVALHKERVELSSQCQNSEKLTGGKVVGLHLESDVTNTGKLLVQKGQEVHLKQSTAFQQKAEVQIEEMEFPSTSCASESHKEVVELSSQCQNSEKSTGSGNVIGLHLESDVTTTSNAQVQEGQEVHLKQSISSIQGVQTEVVAFPSPSCVSKLHKECGELSSQCQNSEKFMSGNEDELIKRNRILEVQNMELRKEIEDLKLENRQLKMYFSSTNDLVTRLEGLVMDETYSS